MNSRQCKELRKVIIEKVPQFKDIEKMEKINNLTPQEKIVLNNLKSQFKKLYKEAKKQYEKTPHNERQVVYIK
jgi:hypothetical protein